jgi:hypothetical protein
MWGNTGFSGESAAMRTGDVQKGRWSRGLEAAVPSPLLHSLVRMDRSGASLGGSTKEMNHGEIHIEIGLSE